MESKTLIRLASYFISTLPEEEDCQGASHLILQTICDVQCICSRVDKMLEGILEIKSEWSGLLYLFLCFIEVYNIRGRFS